MKSKKASLILFLGLCALLIVGCSNRSSGKKTCGGDVCYGVNIALPKEYSPWIH